MRFAQVGPTPHIDAYDDWLAAGHHADMHYLPAGRDERADPRARIPAVRTAMVLGLRHGHRRPDRPAGLAGQVARYAWGRDYHNIIGKRLRKLRKRLSAEGIESWGGVDTAPILERAWAGAAGLGFTGKNCVQILPGDTSWMVLAVVFLTAEVPPDLPLRDHCGRCTRCLPACPTQAFVGPRILDARRCISYWTIESRDLAPRALRKGFGDWFFGCDVCQEVCPHNGKQPDPSLDDFAPRHAWIDLDGVLRAPDQALLDRFLGTPLRRPGAAGLKRNAALALGNLGDRAALPALRFALGHEAPVVRAAAVWALDQLSDTVSLPDSDPSPVVTAELEAVTTKGEVEARP